MNIYLVCNAGMSTSILVKKMQEAAAKKSLDDVHIEAFSVEVLDEHVDATCSCIYGIFHQFLDDRCRTLHDFSCCYLADYFFR